MAPTLSAFLSAGKEQGGAEFLESLARYRALKVDLGLQSNEGLNAEEVVALVNWAFDQEGSLLKSAVAVIDDGGSKQRLNLMRLRITQEREMQLLSPRARSIDHASAREQIALAYDARQPQIAKALASWGDETEEGSA